MEGHLGIVEENEGQLDLVKAEKVFVQVAQKVMWNSESYSSHQYQITNNGRPILRAFNHSQEGQRS